MNPLEDRRNPLEDRSMKELEHFKRRLLTALGEVELEIHRRVDRKAEEEVAVPPSRENAWQEGLP